MSAPAITPAPAVAPAAVPAGAELCLQQTRDLLKPVLWEWISLVGGRLTAQSGYQLDLCDRRGVPTGRLGGKLVRPAFTLLCARAAGGSVADALPAAAAVELLHNASLVHDDIMDGDRERRHRPTVWAAFGVPSAILVGDGLIALGFEALAGSTHPAMPGAVSDLARTLRVMGRGQDGDLSLMDDDRVGLDDCLAMLAGKTGVLLGAACRMGVSFSPAPRAWANRFEEFGTRLGVAFQLVDDVLDIWGETRLTGKPVGSDLRARKKSAPVVAALVAGTSASRRLARIYAGTAPLTEAEVADAAALVDEAGGRAWAEAETHRQLEQAWNQLSDLDLDPEPRADLESLSNALITRHH